MTGLVMTGRLGATIAAEIGTMRVSEQIDALESLSFDPVSFLILPRILAAAIMFPIPERAWRSRCPGLAAAT